jgi:isopenicillin-N N-acyltransferase-like protein
MTSLQVLELAGSPRERGRAHGEALRSQIVDYLGVWKEALGQDTGLDPGEYLSRFVRETNFMPAVERWTPGLLAEVQGIAEGSGVDFDTIWAVQLGDEEWWYRRDLKLAASDSDGRQCSGLAVFDRPDSPPLLAQNMDVPGYHDGFQVLLRIEEPDSPVEALVFTTAGFIALNGLNNRSVGICCNTLFQLDYAPDGLPVAFVVRGVLSRPTQDDAVAFVRGVKHASGQNYLVGGPGSVLDFECSANQVVQYQPAPGATRVAHTNHPLANDEQGMYQARLQRLSPGQREQEDKEQAGTRARFAFLERELGDPAETITVGRIQAMLSSHEAPVCNDRQPGEGLTLGCLVMELAPSPILHIAPGPPCSTPFETFGFE